jgi:hypothetical protein
LAKPVSPLKAFFIFFVFCFGVVTPQTTTFGDIPVKWESTKQPSVSKTDGLNDDLIILDEKTEFHFYSKENEKIIRNILIKINSAEGVKKLTSFELPETFDYAYDAEYYKQGRKSKIKIPFTTQYTVTKFGGRKYADKNWSPINFKLKFNKVRWINYMGEFLNDEITEFQLQDLKIGDIVELHYESAFNSNYGSNLFYFNSKYPKLACKYTFYYKVDKQFLGYSFILPNNIHDSLISRSYQNAKDYQIYIDEIKLKNLAGINYPANSCESKTLPHVFADFRFYRILNRSYPDGGTRIFEYSFFRPKNFEWIIYSDTTNSFTKIYDKQFTALRKFTTSLPKTDSVYIPFFKALCDTFNNFRYISSNHLYYNESALYELYSGEHLLKRRLVEHSLWKVYRDILNDKKIFYYVANIQDRRYGEHSLSQRAHYAYEDNIIAIPTNSTFVYFMPRYNGLKYHLNELPFYYEGSLAALTARNFQTDTKDKEKMTFKLLKTHKGTFNENTRTENAVVSVNLDSSYAKLVIKESLSGQFSTLLRHLYLNEFIDSTVSTYYFKKCVDKPSATQKNN